MKTNLCSIPYVEKVLKGFTNIGITCVEDLQGKNPEELYLKSCEFKDFKEDRCLLYIFRMAVY